ncbi:Glycosyl transferases group 1 [Rubripirellula amarantea]|uniref:Glycosyl transferases group 1 n=2 Tax=Rubripirellula amarantea TaxID=2527999 RepID=A0A5C5WVU4_9BACT|nr:Glycosyl transferases group 1 [Rubripirellula amarantea]
MLTHRFPYPPNRGDRIRSYNLLRLLSQYHRITLCCPTDEPVSQSQLDHVNAFCERSVVAPLSKVGRLTHAIRSYANGKSLSEGMFFSSSLQRQVKSLHAQTPFQTALVYCSSMFPYVDQPSFRDTRKIVDVVDVDSRKWKQMSQQSTRLKRWIYGCEAERVQRLEQRIADRADGIALVSDLEASLFERTVCVAKSPLGISNGVDSDFFYPHDAVHRPNANRKVTKLVFTGVLDYHPNVEGLVWFCRDLLPQLRQSKPIELEIVGRRACGKVKDLALLPGVNLVGEVEDVRPYLHNADIAISPLKLARGIQNKVLEAMAARLPVVLTTESAEGIDATTGVDFQIADSVEQWRHAILKLSDDAELRTSMGRSASKLVSQQYSWNARLNKFLTLTQPASLNGQTDTDPNPRCDDELSLAVDAGAW